MGKTDWFWVIVCIVLFVTFFAPFVGYSVNGYEHNISEDDPGVLGIVDYVWDSAQFFFYINTFQVDGIPALVSMVFLAIQLMGFYLFITLVRGT